MPGAGRASPSPTRCCDGARPMTEHHFTAELWLWDARRQDTWTFVTLPPEVSAAVEDEADGAGPPRRVRLGAGGGADRAEHLAHVAVPRQGLRVLRPAGQEGCQAGQRRRGGRPVEVELRLL